MCIPTSHWLLRKKSTERLKKGIQLPACSLEKSRGRSLSKREYGVTFVGARDQIERQLKERKDIPHEKVWAAASYLANLKKVKIRVSFIVFLNLPLLFV